MAKAKITLLMELEYEINPDHYYEEHDTDEKRLAYDIETAKKEFALYLQHPELQLSEVEGMLIVEDTNEEDNTDTDIEKPVD